MLKKVVMLTLLSGLLLTSVRATLAKDLIEYALIISYADAQSIEVKDAAGTVLGNGTFQADVSYGNGRTSGKALLQLPEYTVEIAFAGVDEILYEGGNPVGVVLSGRGTLLKEGQTETFPATATVRGGATTTIPDCLIWDIPEPAILDGLNFEAEGMLQFRE